MLDEYYTKQIRYTSIEELENLPKLDNKCFGWSEKSVPMIFILCKDFDDKERMFDYLCTKSFKNPFLFVDSKEDMFGQNGFAIIKSKNFNDDEIFRHAITRIMNRLGQDKFNNKFYPYIVVEEK